MIGAENKTAMADPQSITAKKEEETQKPDAFIEAAQEVARAFTVVEPWTSKLQANHGDPYLNIFIDGDRESPFHEFSTYGDLASAIFEKGKEMRRSAVYEVPNAKTGDRDICNVIGYHHDDRGYYFVCAVRIQHNIRGAGIKASARDYSQSGARTVSVSAEPAKKKNLAF